jgi:DNA-binding MarR family transcriptional regulator
VDEDELDEATYRAHAVFRRALREFLRFSEAAARAEGVTPEQHQLLLALRGAPEGWLHVGDVARELLIAPHSAAGLVERAAARGLVVKAVDPSDRRSVRVYLTERGRQIVARLTRRHRAELRRLWAQIPRWPQPDG